VLFYALGSISEILACEQCRGRLGALNQDTTSEVFSELLKDVFCNMYASIVGKGQGINKFKVNELNKNRQNAKAPSSKAER
jgi:hypothetical protein